MAKQLAYLTGNPRVQAIVDLVIISFYYILRSRELKKPRKVKRNGKLVIETRTQQFRVKYVGLWENGKTLSRHESMNTLIEPD